MVPFFKAWLAGVAFFGYNGFFTHVPSHALRRLYLRGVLGIRLGKGASVHMGCFFTGRNISIGDHTVINRRCHLDGRKSLSIGKNASLSPECYIITLDHQVDSPDFATKAGPVSIGDYAWLGARAMILPGIDVGEGAVVGAGSVLTRNAPPYDIVAGAPARKIGERNRDLRYTLSYFPLFNTDVTLP